MQELKDSSLFRQQCLIAGRWRDAGSGASIAVTDPATQGVIGTVPDVSGAETRMAIEAASTAFGPWRAKTHAERAALLEAWHGLMIKHEEDLALLLTLEQGKPLSEARARLAWLLSLQASKTMSYRSSWNVRTTWTFGV